MVKLFKRLLNTGTDGISEEGRTVIGANAVALIIIFITIPYIIPYYILGYSQLIGLLLAFVVCMTGVLFFNYLKWHKTAKMYLINLGCLYITALSLAFGKVSGFELFFLISAVVSIVIFSKEEIYYLIFSCAEVFIFYPVTQTLYGYVRPLSLENPIFEQFLYYSSVFSTYFVIAGVLFYFRHLNLALEQKVKEENERSEKLLLNILPAAIIERLKSNQEAIAEGFQDTTILFSDIVDFTTLSETISPGELVKLLNEIFSLFDALTDRYDLEKIKTIGDAYMVAGGLPVPREDHAEAVANMALDMQTAIMQFNENNQQSMRVRIGIHSGAAVAGVIGVKKFIYDVWGDTVNTASRMESHGVPGQIHISEASYKLLKDKYSIEERGLIQVKGKGQMRTYLLLAKKPNV
jgi:adenylate cyclase